MSKEKRFGFYDPEIGGVDGVGGVSVYAEKGGVPGYMIHGRPETWTEHIPTNPASRKAVADAKKRTQQLKEKGMSKPGPNYPSWYRKGGKPPATPKGMYALTN